MIRHELRLVGVALQFLTRVPVPRWIGFHPRWLQTCLRHFPLVGAAIGAWAASALWVALLWWPPLVASAVSLMATVWLTGAFHEDGLADTCDALGGVVSRERALTIMKDSRIGSYGAVALVLVLGLKLVVVGALALDGAATAMLALVWAHAVSRAAPVVLIGWLPYAGDPAQAKVKPLATRTDVAGPVVAVAWLVVLGIVLVASTGASVTVTAIVASSLAGVLVTVATGFWLRRRLGGFTGDTLGATQQWVDGAVLLCWLATMGHGRA